MDEFFINGVSRNAPEGYLEVSIMPTDNLGENQCDRQPFMIFLDYGSDHRSCNLFHGLPLLISFNFHQIIFGLASRQSGLMAWFSRCSVPGTDHSIWKRPAGVSCCAAE